MLTAYMTIQSKSACENCFLAYYEKVILFHESVELKTKKVSALAKRLK